MVNESFIQQVLNRSNVPMFQSKGFEEISLFRDTVMKTNIWRAFLQFTKHKTSLLSEPGSEAASLFEKEGQRYHPAEQVLSFDFLLLFFFYVLLNNRFAPGATFLLVSQTVGRMTQSTAPSWAEGRLWQCPFTFQSLTSSDLSQDLP